MYRQAGGQGWHKAAAGSAAAWGGCVSTGRHHFSSGRATGLLSTSAGLWRTVSDVQPVQAVNHRRFKDPEGILTVLLHSALSEITHWIQLPEKVPVPPCSGSATGPNMTSGTELSGLLQSDPAPLSKVSLLCPTHMSTSSGARSALGLTSHHYPGHLLCAPCCLQHYQKLSSLVAWTTSQLGPASTQRLPLYLETPSRLGHPPCCGHCAACGSTQAVADAREGGMRKAGWAGDGKQGRPRRGSTAGARS